MWQDASLSKNFKAEVNEAVAQILSRDRYVSTQIVGKHETVLGILSKETKKVFALSKSALVLKILSFEKDINRHNNHAFVRKIVLMRFFELTLANARG